MDCDGVARSRGHRSRQDLRVQSAANAACVHSVRSGPGTPQHALSSQRLARPSVLHVQATAHRCFPTRLLQGEPCESVIRGSAIARRFASTGPRHYQGGDLEQSCRRCNDLRGLGVRSLPDRFFEDSEGRNAKRVGATMVADHLHRRTWQPDQCVGQL